MATKKITIKKKTTKKKSLSKGLDAIFGADLEQVIKEVERTAPRKKTTTRTKKPTTKVQVAAEKLLNQVIGLKVTEIIANPYQPRRVFDQEKLKELSLSIKENGLLTPIVVRKNKVGSYYIIAGERRFRATKLAGLKQIQAIVIEVTDRKMQELALIENIQREDLNPIEEAVAVQQLIEDHKITHEAASKILGKSRTYITNILRLLKLDQIIIDAVLSGKLTFGHAKPLVGLDTATVKLIYNRIQEEGLTVREVENIVRGYKLRDARTNAAKKDKPKKSAAIEYAEELLRNKIRSKVEITNNKIIIKYKGNEQLNRILERIDALDK